MTSFVVLSGERNFHIIDREMLREVLLTDVIADLRGQVLARSGDRTGSVFGRENSGANVDVVSAGVGTVRKKANDPIWSAGEVLYTSKAGKLTVAACGSLEEAFLGKRWRSAT